MRTVTYERPGSSRRRGAGGRGTAGFDWGAVRPVGAGEVRVVFMAALVMGFFATLVCYAKGYLLLYGDAVAHLAIARRILDARWPGVSQLGGVWLPLPHLLMLPFVQKMAWWQSGLGGAPMSVLSYAASVAGVWRLARRMMAVRWALVAATFYALNANLLFLASTAMTEALFLALLVWTVVAAVETVAALRAGNERRAERWMVGAGLLILAQVFTRYDGWVVGAAVWCCFAWELWRGNAALRRRMLHAFAVFTVLCVMGPAVWFWFNHHFMGDWLDFVRGPYSAQAIERRTAPPGQHYRGWMNPAWALLFYMRTAQVDASVWETGWAVMVAALVGLWVYLRKPMSENPASSTGSGQAIGHPASVGKAAWLLWLPLPFYVYSVAYGSVPIFIPQLWPHSYYNSRYGMELLPALSVYAALAAWRGDAWLRARTEGLARVAARLAQPVAMLLCVANCLAMMYRVPLVLKEGMVNATTRVAFERGIAEAMERMPMDAPVMMYTSAHVGAVQVAGRTLRSMVSEQDWDSWHKALEAPAANADYVIAIAGDPVADAVKAHPEGLTELEVICTTGQPCARVYKADRVGARP
ncbi:MAG: hypothetical protein M3R43_02200 [Acidobacteriota bacterium]|nr:hypothetical protein [Acidobacteriota bacterium]